MSNLFRDFTEREKEMQRTNLNAFFLSIKITFFGHIPAG